jgi:hypothetical protein
LDAEFTIGKVEYGNHPAIRYKKMNWFIGVGPEPIGENHLIFLNDV